MCFCCHFDIFSKTFHANCEYALGKGALHTEMVVEGKIEKYLQEEVIKGIQLLFFVGKAIYCKLFLHNVNFKNLSTCTSAYYEINNYVYIVGSTRNMC